MVAAFTPTMAFGGTGSPFLPAHTALSSAPCLAVAAARLKIILGIDKMSCFPQREHSFILPALHHQLQVSLKWLQEQVA